MRKVNVKSSSSENYVVGDHRMGGKFYIRNVQLTATKNNFYFLVNINVKTMRIFSSLHFSMF